MLHYGVSTTTMYVQWPDLASRPATRRAGMTWPPANHVLDDARVVDYPSDSSVVSKRRIAAFFDFYQFDADVFWLHSWKAGRSYWYVITLFVLHTYAGIAKAMIFAALPRSWTRQPVRQKA